MAAITAQLTESARLAKGLAGAVLGLAFVLRAAGDAGATTGVPLTWLSPLGWAENVRPFADERWWMLLLFVAASRPGAVAYALAGRRDLGMSFLPARPGPAAGRLAAAGAWPGGSSAAPCSAGPWASPSRASSSAASPRARPTWSATTSRPARSSRGWAGRRA